ncbi:2,3-dimethylmalate lyase [bioreactor metagenome]|uniref:2,3-dimethylmalate lyase n=1 Tax=bioreactor metagenome TaxID=1076179 RepID=A0A645GMC4_9ZZZZ
MKKINEAISVYTLANMVEGGRTPLVPNDKLAAMGYNLVIYPTASTYVTTKAMLDLMEGLKKDGTTATMIDKMIPFPQFNDLIGLPRIREIEAKYANRG